MRDLVYGTTAIRSRDEMVSLTDMWRANGEEESRRPVHWLKQKETRQFLDHLFIALNITTDHLIQSRQGRYGGTWAHWQVGLAYARYLSPEFHAWTNTVVRERMEGRAQPQSEPAQVEMLLPPQAFESDAFTKEDGRKGLEWLHRNMRTMHEHNRAEFRAAIAEAIAEFWRGVGHLKNKALTPEHLLSNGVLMLPAPTPDTRFLTATQVCWRVIPDERLHRFVPGIIGRQLQSHARKHRWPQGETDRLSKRDRPMPTYPESRVEEWLAAGGAATIEHENDWQRRSEAVEAGAIPLHQTA
jgi:hypothetical protein